MMTAAEQLPPHGLTPSTAMRSKFLHELAETGLPKAPRHPLTQLVTESDLNALPAPARQFMRFSRVLDRPRDWSFCARWDGRFRLKPTQDWMACEGWQYDTNVDIARIFHMRMHMGHVLPTYVRDLYAHGGGHMLGKLFDTFSIVDDSSQKVTVGELVTYLNDVLLFAPSMLLNHVTRWLPVDDHSFDVSITDHANTVTGRVFVDERGALTDFSTIDRFGQDPAHASSGLVRTRWSTPVSDWIVLDDRVRPVDGRAIWHFPSGDFCYAEFATANMEIVFNVPPGKV
jgi:hypothetical protein